MASSLPDRLPFRFIDQQELRQPKGSSLRKAVRSHARRDAALKRQQRNKCLVRTQENPRKLLGKENVQGLSPLRPNTTWAQGGIAGSGGSTRDRELEPPKLLSHSENLPAYCQLPAAGLVLKSLAAPNECPAYTYLVAPSVRSTLLKASWRQDPFDAYAVLKSPRVSLLLSYCKFPPSEASFSDLK
jgi:hypothetical protein